MIQAQKEVRYDLVDILACFCCGTPAPCSPSAVSYSQTKKKKLSALLLIGSDSNTQQHRTDNVVLLVGSALSGGNRHDTRASGKRLHVGSFLVSSNKSLTSIIRAAGEEALASEAAVFSADRNS